MIQPIVILLLIGLLVTPASADHHAEQAKSAGNVAWAQTHCGLRVRQDVIHQFDLVASENPERFKRLMREAYLTMASDQTDQRTKCKNLRKLYWYQTIR